MEGKEYFIYLFILIPQLIIKADMLHFLVQDAL